MECGDGVVLPNLKMVGEEERCAFLDKEGRCSIHKNRPGICRLFPLGRFYENGDFRYFLQTKECPAPNRSKIKVSKWIDTPDESRNHAFIRKWHYLLNELEERMGETEDMEARKQMNMILLQTFYMKAYDTEKDFYGQFAERLAAVSF